jgi:hypothetical protein
MDVVEMGAVSTHGSPQDNGWAATDPRGAVGALGVRVDLSAIQSETHGLHDHEGRAWHLVAAASNKLSGQRTETPGLTV